jgi:predicted nucleic acid-binding protein
VAYVIDTSALVPLLLDQPGADEVERILSGEDDDVLLAFMTLMELRYVLARVLPPERVRDIIETLRATGATILESDPEWGIIAAQVKARGGLSVADAWIAALALIHDARLVHKDPEFDPVEGLKAVRLR